MSETTVGCERPDGTLNIHAAADTCEVCAVREMRESESAQHTGDCRRWRLVTGHRREYQGSHACTCGASSQREEPPT